MANALSVPTSNLAAGSIVVAFAVLILKGTAWWLTGSVALYSDALESIVNLITALVALYAIHVSAQPADRRHQFGHHKAEYFSVARRRPDRDRGALDCQRGVDCLYTAAA
jgi:divalent metal cation (Fe/Co/Zn/Cd) transporter